MMMFQSDKQADNEGDPKNVWGESRVWLYTLTNYEPVLCKCLDRDGTSYVDSRKTYSYSLYLFSELRQSH